MKVEVEIEVEEQHLLLAIAIDAAAHTTRPPDRFVFESHNKFVLHVTILLSTSEAYQVVLSLWCYLLVLAGHCHFRPALPC